MLSGWAEAWEFASFWCSASLLTGADDSGLLGQPQLSDTLMNFLDAGFDPGKGQTLWNLTQGTSGPITAVSEHSLTATGVTWNDGDLYRAVTLTAQEKGAVDHHLALVAADIRAALAAQGMLSCTLANWAADLLKKINIIEAAAFYDCPCGSPGLSDDAKERYLNWAGAQLDLIRTGRLELCEGHTGAEFPAAGWAEQSVTERNAAQIIVNDAQRNA